MFGHLRTRQQRKQIREAGKVLLDELLPTDRNKVAHQHLMEVVVPGAQAMVAQWEAEKDRRASSSNLRNAAELVFQNRLIMASTALTAGLGALIATEWSLPVAGSFSGIAAIATAMSPGRMSDSKIDTAIRETNRLIRHAEKAGKAHANYPANPKNDKHFDAAIRAADQVEIAHRGQPPIGMSLQAFIDTLGPEETDHLVRRARELHPENKAVQKGLDHLVRDAGDFLKANRTRRFRDLAATYHDHQRQTGLFPDEAGRSAERKARPGVDPSM